MRLLLDSQALFSLCQGNALLGAAAPPAIEKVQTDMFVIHTAAWEFTIKISPGKRALATPCEEFFPGAALADGFQETTGAHCNYRALRASPFHHRHPSDLRLIAQAKVKGFTVVTSDPQTVADSISVLW